MTLVDAMTLVLGVALAFVATPGRMFFLHMPAVWILAFFGLIDLTRGLLLAVSLVVLARVAMYRRMPRPSEWLAILVTASMVAERPELNVDGLVNRLYAAFPGLNGSTFDFGKCRWLIAGVELLVVLAGLLAIRLVRRRFPTWSKILALTGLATLTISGPFAVFGLQGADLISPSEGFGPGFGPILLRKAYWLAAQVPLGLLFGIPAFQALAERIGGRRWAWTEWGGASLSLAIGVILLVFDRNEFPIPSWGWIIELSMTLSWIFIVFLLSQVIVNRLGLTWRRWIGDPDDQPRGPASVETSPARHF